MLNIKSLYVPLLITTMGFIMYSAYINQQTKLLSLTEQNTQLVEQVSTLTKNINDIKEHQNFVNGQLSILDNKVVNIDTYTDSLINDILNNQTVRKSNVKKDISGATVSTNERIRQRLQSIGKASSH